MLSVECSLVSRMFSVFAKKSLLKRGVASICIGAVAVLIRLNETYLFLLQSSSFYFFYMPKFKFVFHSVLLLVLDKY